MAASFLPPPERLRNVDNGIGNGSAKGQIRTQPRVHTFRTQPQPLIAGLKVKQDLPREYLVAVVTK